jgi:two-component system sensor histidine kinase MprB
VSAWLRRKSFRVRLGALVAVAVGVTMAVSALVAYFVVHHQLYNQVDSSLQAEVAAALSHGGFDPLQEGTFFRQYNGTLVQVIDAGNPTPTYFSLIGTGAPDLPISGTDAAIASAKSPGPAFRDIRYEGQAYRMITVAAQDRATGSSAAIQLARPLTDIATSLRELRLILWLVAIGGVGVAVGLGYLIGRATIRPVERLTAAAEHVAATQNLSAKIDDRGEDELARLAHAFNEMLRALASSRQQQAQLISDAGHELRTPLTSLRTNIEVLLRVRELPVADRAELLTDVQAQLEELTTLIGDVVELGREDELQSEPIEVRLDHIVERAVERARRRAPSLRFDVELTPGSVRAQPSLLERAILNVLDNAAKWSPPNGTVHVRLRRTQVWGLDVLDEGPGIAAADLPYVFDRFYRSDAARALPGSGLGLAIVRQVVTAHGGAVWATSPPSGGTLIHMELPTVAEQEPAPAQPRLTAANGHSRPYGPEDAAADNPYQDLAGRPTAE